jgi:hypothetical protein
MRVYAGFDDRPGGRPRRDRWRLPTGGWGGPSESTQYSTLMRKPWPTTHFPDMRRTPCRIASLGICNHARGSRHFSDAGQAS